MAEGKPHLGLVIVGHVDAGKSTTTGRLLFELGGMSDRDLAKLKKEAAELGKESFLFAFFMDKGKDERARGVTIQCCTREFFTESYHYTIIDAPGHRYVDRLGSSQFVVYRSIALYVSMSLSISLSLCMLYAVRCPLCVVRCALWSDG